MKRNEEQTLACDVHKCEHDFCAVAHIAPDPAADQTAEGEDEQEGHSPHLVFDLELDLGAFGQVVNLRRQMGKELSPIVRGDRPEAHAVGRLFAAERRNRAEKLARFQSAAVVLELDERVQ